MNILMHERTEHERKTELYGYSFFALQKLTQSSEISIPHCAAVQRRTSGRSCPEHENSSILSHSWVLRGVPCRQAPCSMTLLDNRSPLASSNLESSSTTYPHPGTAYSKPALPRRVSEFTAMNGVTFRWYHTPAGFSSHRPSKTRFSLVQS